MKKIAICFIFLLLSLMLFACEAKNENLVNVYFETNGGTHISSIERIEKGSLLTEPKSPYLEKHTFEGWFKDENFLEPWIFAVDVIEDDLTLFAKWKELFLIDYNLDQGFNHPENPTFFQEGDTIDLKLPQKQKSVFDGWFLSDSFTGERITQISGYTQDIVIYAKWIESFNIEYVMGGGYNNPDNLLGFFAGDIVELKPPARAGYEFRGWYLSPDFSGDTIAEIADKTEDITVYARWERIYTITYELNEGYNANNETSYRAGDTVELKPPARAGYEFRGWYLSPDFSGDTITEIADKTEDITIYARWARYFEIEYVLYGGTNNSDNPRYYIWNEPVELRAPVKDGHYFAGWYKDEMFSCAIDSTNFMADENSILHAKFLATSLNMGRLDVLLEDEKPLSEVDRETYVNATISLTQTEKEFILLDIPAEFKGRGNGSWKQEKKGYRIKFNSKQSMFGNEKSKHWAIIPGQSDATVLRNGLAYSVVNNNLEYIEYTTSVNFVEVFVNGEYRGVYLLAEHIRVDVGRVDIDSQYGVEDTGYLIEYDAYAISEGEEDVFYFNVEGLKYPFTLKSPDPEDYLGEGFTKEQFKAQVNYIKSYMQNVVTAILTGDYDTFLELADVDSFVDMYIIHEFFKNTDTGWSSFYFYKKPGGKLYCGPAWDFDLSAGMTRGDSSYTGLYVADMVQQASATTASEIYITLMKNSLFVQAVKQRWNEVSDNIVENIITTLDILLQYSFEFQSEVNFWYPAKIWINEVNKLKQWLVNRADWLNEHWKL